MRRRDSHGIASTRCAAYSGAMGLAVRSFRLQTRAVAVILLALTALMCVASFAHAGMVMVGQDCFGPGCEQQITCARPDQSLAPLRQLPGPVAMAGSAAFDVSPPPGQTMPMAPALGPAIDGPVSPLAPRSPPAA
jgi:hypothetical protein